MKRLMLVLSMVVFLVVGWSSVSYSEISPEVKVKAIQSLTAKIAAKIANRKLIYKQIFNRWKKASPKMKLAIAKRLKIQESKIAGLRKQLSNLKAAPDTELQKLAKVAKGVVAPSKVNLIERLDKEVRSKVYESQPQFQDYKWGSSIEEVRLQINSGDHYDVFEIDTPREKLGIGHRDMILHKKVLIWFLFTPRTEKLCRVKLVWGRDHGDNYDNDYGVKNSLLKILTKKYGEPVRSGLWYDYKWGSYLELWGSVGTTLSYISGEYTPIQVQEEDEVFYTRYRR